MDFEKLRSNIEQVVELLDSVPDSLKERAFDAMLQAAIEDAAGARESKKRLREGEKENVSNVGRDLDGFPILQPRFKQFMQQNLVTDDDLRKVIAFDGGTAHFLVHPSNTKKASAQIDWALLLALVNGIENGFLSVSADAVRTKVADEQILDASHFAENFKSASARDYFLGPMETGKDAKRLSPKGEVALAKLIKDLV